jgi:hypothetical protein
MTTTRTRSGHSNVDNDVNHASVRKEESARRSQASDEAVLLALVHGMNVHARVMEKFLNIVDKIRENAAAREAAHNA